MVRFCSPRDSQQSFLAPYFKSIDYSVLSLLDGPTLTLKHDHWKNCSLAIWTFVSKVMSLLFNTLSRLVIAFLPRSKRLLILWLQSLWDFGAQEIKSVTVSTFPYLFAIKLWDWMP